jgi:hypothetical protein
MKPLLKLVLLIDLFLAALLLTGCQTAAPTAVESALFQIHTNYVPQVFNVTNYVPVTNTVIKFVTNELHQVIEVPVVTILSQTNVTTLTNIFEATEWTTKTNVTAAVGAAGSIINTFAPGIGSLASAIALGLLGIWGTARQKNKQIGNLSQAAQVLTQTIQVGRELIARTPQGAQVADTWKAWMEKNQTNQGAIEQVIALMKLGVDKTDASYTADQLLKLMADVKAGTLPPKPTV